MKFASPPRALPRRWRRLRRAGAPSAPDVMRLDHASRMEITSRMEQVHRTLRQLVARLDELAIPYAIAGTLAMAEHGYERVGTDVDVVLTRDGLTRLKDAVRGQGYVDEDPGRKGLRDTATGIPIDVLVAGDPPGCHDRPSPVVHPDPEAVAQPGRLGKVLPLATLVELELAAGLSSPGRIREFADVLELIRASRLQLDLADRLDASVRDKYRELWQAASTESNVEA